MKKTATKPETACCAPATLSPESKKREQDWQAEDDLRTLIRANEIRKDKGRLARARARAKEQLTAATQAATSV